MQWYLKVLKQYADFSGRARRTEFWMFTLFSAIASIVLGLIDTLIGTSTMVATGSSVFYSPGLLQGIYALGVLIPTLAVTVRRLHDTDRTGWWLLIAPDPDRRRHRPAGVHVPRGHPRPQPARHGPEAAGRHGRRLPAAAGAGLPAAGWLPAAAGVPGPALISPLHPHDTARPRHRIRHPPGPVSSCPGAQANGPPGAKTRAAKRSAIRTWVAASGCRRSGSGSSAASASP